MATNNAPNNHDHAPTRRRSKRLFHRRRLLDFVEQLEDRRMLAVAFNSIQRELPTQSVTNADALVFRATFSAAVKNVDPTDFVVTGTTAAITTLVPEGTGNNIFAITVSGGNLPSLQGTVGLNLAAGQNIQDLNNVALPTIEPPIDEVYTIDNTAISGVVFNDDNANGTRDPGDNGIAGRTVYLDANNNGVFDSTGSGPQTFNSTSSSSIFDFSTVNNTISVTGVPGQVADVNVTVNISHTFDSDLTVSLISPGGTQVTLFSGVGGSLNNFTNTVLDDEASTLISSGSAPFTGSYRPSSSLTAVDGSSPNGTWTLRVYDGSSGDTGTLSSWSITITPSAIPEKSTTTDAGGNYLFAGVTPGNNVVRQVLPSLWHQSYPLSNAAQIVNSVTGVTASNRDFGAYTDNVNVTIAPNSVLEDGTANLVYTFTHNGSITSDVTVNFSLSGTANAASDYTVIGAATFAPATGTGTIIIPAGASTATLTIDPVADTTFSLDKTVTAAVQANATYELGNPSFATGTITNDDTANISISPPSGYFTTEAGIAVTFTVVLTSPPTASVTLPVTSLDTTEGTVAPSSVLFTTTNWNVPQTVTITGVNDFLDDGDIIYTVQLGALVSSDATFNGFNPADLSLTNTDDDTAGILVSPTSGLVTTEAGSTATFTVVLQSQPTSTVTIPVTSLDLTEGSVNVSSLAFTAVNWNVPQTVTVTGVNDVLVDSDILYTIQLGSAISIDPLYNVINPADVTVTNTDLTPIGFAITPTSGLTTTENGTSTTFTVQLTIQPTADVSVPVSSLNTTEGVVNASNLVFTSTNWNIPQVVTVTGVDDTADDGDILYTIQLDVATSADARFNGLDPSDVTITNIDDDANLVANTGTTVVEGGTHIITSAELNVTDVAATPSQITYRITTAPIGGQLEFTSAPNIAITSFTQDDVNNSKVLYRHNGSETTADSFAFTAATPYLTQMVKDIYVGSGGSTPQGLTLIGSTIFFQATDSAHGAELWKSDGTAAGTVLVRDIYPGSGQSMPKYLTNVNGTLFFYATDGISGYELWKSDGTASGTSLVKDIRVGTGNANIKSIVNVNGIAYFRASDGINGYELWKSDGTAAGTSLVKDIYSGSNSSDPKYLVNVNGTLYFNAADGTNGNELWKSDGTAAGTVMVSDIYVGIGSSSPKYLFNHNGILLFSATTSAAGRELWKSDGTAAGTILLKDIYSGLFNSSPYLFTTVGSTVFFSATSTASSTELWATDGTSNGTVMVKTIDPSNSREIKSPVNINGTLFMQAADSFLDPELWRSNGSSAGTFKVVDLNSGNSLGGPQNLTNVNGTVYFSGANNSSNIELWKSDGTATGTVLVSDIYPGGSGSYPKYLTNVNGVLYFSANNGTNGRELWMSSTLVNKSSATFNFTITPVNDPPLLATNAGSKATVNTSDPIVPTELKVTDPDNIASQLVFTVTTAPSKGHLELTTNPSAAISSFSQADIASNQLVYVNTDGIVGSDSFVFTLNDGAGGAIAATTFNITVLPVPAITVTPTSGLITTEAGGTASFTVVLTTQPTANVTVPVASLDLTEGTVSTSSLAFTTTNWNTPQTVTVTGVNDIIVDGDIQYTIQLDAAASADPIYNSMNPSDVTVTNTDTTPIGSVVSPVSGLSVSESGTTASFTVLLTAQPTGNVTIPVASLDLTEGTVSVSSLVFTAANWNVPQTVTITGVDDSLDDGDVTFTIQLGSMTSSDSRFNGLDPSDVQVTNRDNDAAISANTGATVLEGGTHVITISELNVTNIGASPGQIQYAITTPPVNGQLELSSAPGAAITRFTQADVNNNQLVYRHSGSETTSDSFQFKAVDSSGTALVKDIYAGSTDSSATNFVNVGGTLFFRASDATNGAELWKSDGTTAGTVLVKDIYSGSSGSAPSQLFNFNGTLFFQARDNANGYELWKSDGTTAGTVLVKDIYTGSTSSSPTNFTIVGSTLFFVAANPSNAGELWQTDGTAAGTFMVKDVQSSSSSSPISSLVNVNGTLFFKAEDTYLNPELWKSDGTAAGTVMVKETIPSTSFKGPQYLTNVGGTLFYRGADSSINFELWKSDGTAAGTVMVKDIYNGGFGSYPKYLTNVGGKLFFQADESSTGYELWESDGTTAGTVSVADILASGSSNPRFLTNVNGTLFFRATDTTGNFLWKSDGTATGTVRVKTVVAGSSATTGKYLENVNGILYFRGSEAGSNYELWSSDGTTAGTTLVKEIYSGSVGASPSNLTNVNGVLFFTANDGSNGTELWKSSPATNTTGLTSFNLTVTPVNDPPTISLNTGFSVMVNKTHVISSTELSATDVDNTAGQLTFTVATGPTKGHLELATNPGVAITNFTQANLAANQVLYVNTAGVVGNDSFNFIVNDGSGGTTATATCSVTVLPAPGFTVTPTSGLTTSETGTSTTFTVVLNTQPTSNVTIPFTSLDTTEGTVQFSSFTFSTSNWNVPQTQRMYGVNDQIVDGNVVYTIQIGAATSTDPNYNGIDPPDVSVTNLDTTPITAIVTPTSGLTTNEFGKTATFTVVLTLQPVANVTIPITSSNVAEGTVSPASLVFTAANWNTAQTITITGIDDLLDDGDIAYTVQLAPFVTTDPSYTGLDPADVAVTNLDNDATLSLNTGATVVEGGTHLITSSELKITDGVTPAAQTIFQIVTPPASGQIELIAVPGVAINRFTQDDINNNRVLYRHNGGESPTDSFVFTSGDPGGAAQVKDIFAGSLSSSPSYLTNVNGTLFFRASDSTNGAELWKSDGTAAGTTLVKDILSSPVGSNPKFLTNVNGTLFFQAAGTPNNAELWKSDGTAAGTVLVKEINGSSFTGSNPSRLTNVNGTLFFAANDGINGYELWKSDGTAAGTVMVKDISSGSSSSDTSYLTNVNGILYFGARDSFTGYELWKSDGTAAGTVQVKDIYPGSAGSAPNRLTNVNGTLFFAAGDTNGMELWKSDGTSAGTVLVKDINPGSFNSSNPTQLFNQNGTLYFAANNGSSGIELWKSDGTSAGTVQLKDISIGSSSSSPASFFNLNGTLIFSASDSVFGNELWKSDGTTAGTVQLKDIYPGSIPSNPKYFVNLDGVIYFRAAGTISGYELWKTDGTTAGTLSVQGTNLNTNFSGTNGIVNLNHMLLFPENDGSSGTELWKFTNPTGAVPNSTFQFTVTPVNDAPTLGKNLGTTALEGSADTITNAELLVNDVDNTPAQIVFTATKLPVNGRLELTTAPGVAINVFTQDDVNSNKVIYKHNGSETTADQLAFAVSDGAGGSLLISSFNITITPVNDIPVLTTNTGFILDDGSTHTISASELAATDSDNTPAQLSFTLSTLPAHGQLELTTAPNVPISVFTQADINGNKLIYRDGSEGITDSFTLTVSDGAGGSITGVVINVLINPINDNPPVITSNGGGATAIINLAENTSQVTTVVATDADVPAPTLVYSITGGADAALFAIDAASGALTFKTLPDFEAPTDSNGDNLYLVTVQASDGLFMDSQAITVKITDVNDNPPIITSNGGGATAIINLAENTSQVTTVVATDVDASATTFVFSITGGADAALFAIDAASGVLTFKSLPDFEAPTDSNGDNLYLVTAQVSDGLFVDSQAITVKITDVNDPPIITSNGGGATAIINLAENTSQVTTVVATDADVPAPTLAYSITGGADAALFSIDAASGVLTFKALPDFEVPTDTNGDNIYLLTVQASDGLLVDSQAITVKITDVNENPPIITSNGGGATAIINLAENTSQVTTVVATDADASATTFVFSITGGADAALFSIDAASGVLTFKTLPDFEAPADTNGDNLYLVTAQVSDGLFVDSQAITVKITDVNDPPVITSNGGDATAIINLAENTSQVTTVVATDADVPATTLVYSITGGADAALFAIDAASGALTFKSLPDFEVPTDTNGDNLYLVTVQVSDGLLVDSQAITLKITDINEPPMITSNGGGATAAVNVTESVRGSAVPVTTVTATDAEVTAGKQSLAYSIAGGLDAAQFSIDATTGLLAFQVLPDFENPADSNKDNVYQVIVRASDNGTPIASHDQTIAVTVTDGTYIASQLSMNPAGDIQLDDIANLNNVYTLSHVSGSYIIIDNNGDPDASIDISSVPTAKHDPTNADKILIPDASFVGTGGKPLQLLVNSGQGNDAVNLDTNNLTSPIPVGGLSINLGLGTDTLQLINNATDNLWMTTAAQDGTLTLGGGLGAVTFQGLENAIGGAGKDTFNLNFTGANGIVSLNGGDAANTLDRIQFARGGAFTLTDSKLAFVPSTAMQAAGQAAQTFTLTNIKRANLTGSSGNDSFDLSGWTQHGDGTSTNGYGGLIAAGGGTDALIKKADLTFVNISDSSLQTSDGMQLGLGGNLIATVQDTSAASPVSMDITGLKRTANLIANKNPGDTIKVSGGFANVVLENSFMRVNQTKVNLTGFNSSNVIGSTNDQSSWYKNLAWTGTQTFDGAAGNDMVIVSADQNLVMTPSLLTLGANNPFKINLANIDTFKYKAFDPTLGPTSSHDNTVTLSDWVGAGIVESGDGNDVLIVNKSNATAAQTIEIKPSAMTINGKVIQLAKSDPSKFDAYLSGGSGNDSITLTNWKGIATLDGTSGNDRLSIARDRDQIFDAGKVNILKSAIIPTEADRLISYNNFDHLAAAGGNGNNIFTLNTGYDTGLAADSTGLSLKGTGNTDTLKTSIDANIDVIGGSAGKVVIGSRTLAFTGFDYPEVLDFKPATAGTFNYTFTNYPGRAMLDGAKGLTFTATGTVGTSEMFTSNIIASGKNIMSVKNLGSGGLMVVGSSGNDTFDAANFSGGISIDGGAGNDIIFGGAGNDTLQGGAGDDWIAGGAGNDILLGGAGRDILIGGAGADKLNTTDGTSANSDADDDILIGGTTSYDTNKAALAAILAEWVKSTTFVARVTQIKTTGTTTGGFKLTNLATATVFDDNAVDLFFGGLDEDWFFAKQTTETTDANSPGELAQQVKL